MNSYPYNSGKKYGNVYLNEGDKKGYNMQEDEIDDVF
jgi:hypothetical protein